MTHPLTLLLSAIFVIFIGKDCVEGQTLSTISIPGFQIQRVGCFTEKPAARSIPTLLFSDLLSKSKFKVNYAKFGGYIKDIGGRCGTAAGKQKKAFFSVTKIGECRSGKGVSATYAKYGKSTDCKNALGRACGGLKEDCVGGPNSNFVYKLKALPTTPTTKPTTKPAGASTTGGATKKPSAATLSALACQSYLVAVKATAGSAATNKPGVPTPATKPTVKGAATVPTAATPSTVPPTPSGKAAIEAKVKSIYKGYSCLVCLKTVNSSSSTVFLMLKFTCQGQHLKKLVDGLGAANIIKAECYPPPCTYSFPFTSPCPAPAPCPSPCVTMSPPPMPPAVCPAPPPPAPVALPAPLPPPQCPMSCPPSCAPACNSFCCRSMIRSKKVTGLSAKKSSTENVDDDEDEDEIDDDDDIDIDDEN